MEYRCKMWISQAVQDCWQCLLQCLFQNACDRVYCSYNPPSITWRLLLSLKHLEGNGMVIFAIVTFWFHYSTVQSA